MCIIHLFQLRTQTQQTTTHLKINNNSVNTSVTAIKILQERGNKARFFPNF